jgi:hypothetical protein
MEKKLFFIIIICATLFSCKNNNKQIEFPERKPVNYIVLLDLSDRLIEHGQSERDIEIVNAVYDLFEQSVRQNLVINSKDKFQVIMAPQKGIPYDCSEYEDALFIDMGTINAGIKLNTLGEFRANLKPVLAELYRKANLGNRTSDYPGTGISDSY